MSSRRRSNTIISISVNDVHVEGLNGVMSSIFDHSHNHFQAIPVDRPDIENLSFKSITKDEGLVLTLHFSEVEIKHVV